MIDDKEYNTKDLLVLAGLGPTENIYAISVSNRMNSKKSLVTILLRIAEKSNRGCLYMSLCNTP